jgi:hypothetical protein
MCNFHYTFLLLIVIYADCSLGFLWHFTVMFWKSRALCTSQVIPFTRIKYNINMHSSPVLRIHKTIVERTIMCSGVVEIDQCFRGTCCLHVHCGRVMMETELSSQMLENFYQTMWSHSREHISFLWPIWESQMPGVERLWYSGLRPHVTYGYQCPASTFRVSWFSVYSFPHSIIIFPTHPYFSLTSKFSLPHPWHLSYLAAWLSI